MRRDGAGTEDFAKERVEDGLGSEEERAVPTAGERVAIASGAEGGGSGIPLLRACRLATVCHRVRAREVEGWSSELAGLSAGA